MFVLVIRTLMHVISVTPSYYVSGPSPWAHTAFFYNTCMSRITTFRSTKDRICDSGPKIL